MKGLFSLSIVALALMLGTSGAMLTASTTGAQARARVAVYAKGTQQYHEARMAMCTARNKGMYRNGNDGWVFQHGYCLSEVRY